MGWKGFIEVFLFLGLILGLIFIFFNIFNPLGVSSLCMRVFMGGAFTGHHISYQHLQH